MYIIQEIQTTNSTPTFLPPEVKATRAEAEETVYMKLASAVISAIPVHTIITYTEEGFPIPELTKCFKHDAVQPTPQPEPEPEEDSVTDGEE